MQLALDVWGPIRVAVFAAAVVPFARHGYDVDATVQEPEPDRVPGRATTIVALGDVDGDGSSDWADNVQIVYSAPRPRLGGVIAPDRASFDLPTWGDSVGSLAAAAGDVNGDGYADVFLNSGLDAQAHGDIPGQTISGAH